MADPSSTSHAGTARTTSAETVVARLADETPDGLAVIDQHGRFIHLNPAALTLCGGTEADLRGAHAPFAPDDEGGRESLGLFDDGTIEHVTTFVCASGVRREFAYRLQRVSTDPGYTVVAFRDVTDERHRQRRVTALARTAAKLASQGSVATMLDALAAEVVQTDGLAGVQILTRAEPGGRLRIMGSAGFRHPTDFFDRLMRVHDLGGTLKMLSALETHEPIVVPGRWTALRDDPAWQPLHDYHTELDWDSFASVPLITRGQATGVLNAFFVSGQTVGCRTMEFLAAMAEQAAITVDYAALVERERDVARSEERQRLARDLHDSIVQQVFSASMHVKSMEVLAGRGDTVPAETVARVTEEVSELTRSALADLRAMVHQRRPSASVREVGLSEALRASVEATAARAGLWCDARFGPGIDDLDAELSEDVYRILTEAIHNVVKHADATTVKTHVEVDNGLLEATVVDDGRGRCSVPEHGRGRSDGYGIETMRKRATQWGGTVAVTPGREAGTIVRAVLPSRPISPPNRESQVGAATSEPTSPSPAPAPSERPR